MDAFVEKKPRLEVEHCPSLVAAIEKWKLRAPYSFTDDEEKWSAYVKERSALDWRWNNSWDDKGEELKDLTNPDFPKMDKICSESYASSIDTTTKRQALSLHKVICKNLDAAIDISIKEDEKSLFMGLSGGVYLMEYWINFEDADEPRTIQASLRVYSPVGNCKRIDFCYEYHLRMRFTIDGEYFVNVRFLSRDSSNSEKPTDFLQKLDPRAKVYIFNKKAKKGVDVKEELSSLIGKPIKTKNLKRVFLAMAGVNSFNERLKFKTD